MGETEKDELAFRAAQSGWDNWLGTKWEYSTRPDDAVRKAFDAWLEKNTDQLVWAIAQAVATASMAQKKPGPPAQGD